MLPRLCSIILYQLIGLLAAFSPCVHASSSSGDLSLPQLEKRLVDIDTELKHLAHYSLRSGVGSIGSRSVYHSDAHHEESIEITFKKEFPLDAVVVIPTIRRDSQDGFQADAFPKKFRIRAGTATNTSGTIVAEYSLKEGEQPSIAPTIFSAKGFKASWIRIEASELSKRAFDGKFLLQLSEIMVFSKGQNIALHRPVKTSSTPKFATVAWDASYLVDGHTPYLMDAAHGSQSIGFLSASETEFSFTIDLGKPTPLSAIHLHTLDQSDTIPQSFAGDIGIPHHLQIIGSSHADLTEPITLLDYQKKNIHETGPIMMWNIPETTCQYITIKGVGTASRDVIGFAEVELISKGHNAALNKVVFSNSAIITNHRVRKMTALTDGRNFYGDIIPILDWLKQLSRRHTLELERPAVANALQEKYTLQKENLKFMKWLVALLAASTIIIILIDRVIRQRAVFSTRKRIAANLHDELGANLHAIGLFGDLAKQEVDKADKVGKWNKLVKYVDEIRSLTEHTGKTARYCANMLEADKLYANLVADMTKLAEQLGHDLEHDITFTNEELLQNLKPRRRIGVFLFYKECITNIIRHSDATRVETRVVAEKKSLSISIYDNGKGIDAIPSSLRRRARLLKATLTQDTPETGGTTIVLTMRI